MRRRADRRAYRLAGRKSPFSGEPGHYHRESTVLTGWLSQRAVSAVSEGAGGFWYGSDDEG